MASWFRSAPEWEDVSQLPKTFAGERIDLDVIIRQGKPLPAGIELHWQSEQLPEVEVARSDFDYFQGKWHDVKAMPDVDLLPREAIYRFRDIYMNSRAGIRMHDGQIINSNWLGAKSTSWRSDRNFFLDNTWKIPAASIVLPASGFGHWFLHRLSRLATNHRQLPDMPIVSREMKWNPPFIWEAFGLSATDALKISKEDTAYWRFRELYIPTYSTPLMDPRITDAARMRKDVAELTAGIGGRRGDGFGPEKVFLGRTQEATVRTGVSDPERLEQTFVRRGFVPIDITTLSFPEQVRLIRSAKVIAGEVGSFSMSSIFAEPGLGVITVAARNLHSHKPYDPGRKCFTRSVTDAFQHHQRRIVATDLPRTPGWEPDFELVEAALDSMPEID